MNKQTTRIILTLALAGVTLPAFAKDAALAETEKPRLILQITVDQLRGDLPARFLDRMGEGGFRYLLEEGIVYGNAHHAHANTETIVGHATLATGAHPAAHGMIGNVWLDRGTGAPDLQHRGRPLPAADRRARTSTRRRRSTRPRGRPAPTADRPRRCWSRPSATSSRSTPPARPRSSASRSRIAARSRWRATPERPSGSRRAPASSSPAASTTRTIPSGSPP